MKGNMITKLLPLAAVAAVAFTSMSAVGAQDYKIGVSNTVAGNGWREEMVCAIRAQALVSGKVSSLNIAHRNTDSAGQLEDIRNLIGAGVDAMIINPSSAEGINPAIKDATDAGIVVVVVDNAVSEQSAFVISNNQEEYAYLGARWLFQQLGGEGDVVYMRGIAGVGADNDRDVGFLRAKAEFPGINIVSEVHTGWSQDTGKQQMLNIIASGIPFDGIWTSGIDNVIVDALIESDVPLVPVVGADNAGFVAQLNTVDGLTGAAVTNPGSIGGAGLTLALQILDGQVPSDRTVLVNPSLLENVTEAGQAQVSAASDPSLDPTWPVGLSVEGWTDYSKDQIIACKGPGE